MSKIEEFLPYYILFLYFREGRVKNYGIHIDIFHPMNKEHLFVSMPPQ